jgi:hypothetical protein
MPTIDISDKICPHCGGTKWQVNVSKDGYKRHYCFFKSAENRKRWRSTDEGKAYTNSYYKTKAGKKHKEKYLKKESTQKLIANLAKAKYYRDMLKDPEKVRNKRNSSNKKLREKLTDGMVKHYIIRSYKESGLSAFEIPQELIEIKRKQLLLTRQIKNNV